MARTVFSGGGAGEAGGTAGAPQVPGSAGVLPGTVPRRLVGGVVAYNEEQRLERAVRSLLDQELPAGVEWDRIWIVASGCTDGTVTAAQALARKEPRLALLVEPRRNGKAAAIGRILERAQGDALVLLNSDAEAERGAVRELWTAAAPWIAPYAVMGRPVPTADASGPWRGPLELMWDLHHEFHRHLQEEEGGAHLSDELLLVSLNPGISLPPGVINDGSYLGVWLAGRGGRRIYASDARVRIEVPIRLRDHLRQRRRILFGNHQVAALLGRHPSTLIRHAFEHPLAAARLVHTSVRRHTRGWWRFGALAGAELAGGLLSVWDRLPPQRDHVRWRRIRLPEPSVTERRPAAVETGDPTLSPIERRVSGLLEVAARFRTGIPLQEFVRLLPGEGPETAEAARRWLNARPDIAHLDGELVLAPGLEVRGYPQRAERAAAYRGEAERLIQGPLRWALRWTRCVCLTGSAAYGAPEVGDDLDFFVVCRQGTLWAFLAFAYLASRLDRIRHPLRGRPVPCFNWVVEEGTAKHAFTSGRGFLFAREALTARPLVGGEYYRGLLYRARWMQREIPRMYPVLPEGSVPPEPPTVAGVVRGLNRVTYPWLAAYLQAAGLVRNARFARRPGASDARFRTETRPDQMLFASRRFEALRAEYESFRTETAPPPVAAVHHPQRESGTGAGLARGARRRAPERS